MILRTVGARVTFIQGWKFRKKVLTGVLKSNKYTPYGARGRTCIGCATGMPNSDVSAKLFHEN